MYFFKETAAVKDFTIHELTKASFIDLHDLIKAIIYVTSTNLDLKFSNTFCRSMHVYFFPI